MRLIPNEVGQLTEQTLDIINGLMRARKKGTYSFEHYTERALLALLRDLHVAEGPGQWR